VLLKVKRDGYTRSDQAIELLLFLSNLRFARIYDAPYKLGRSSKRTTFAVRKRLVSAAGGNCRRNPFRDDELSLDEPGVAGGGSYDIINFLWSLNRERYPRNVRNRWRSLAEPFGFYTGHSRSRGQRTFVQYVPVANGVLPGDPAGDLFIHNTCRDNLSELALAGFFLLMSAHVFTQRMSHESFTAIFVAISS